MGKFRKDWLPDADQYFKRQGITLTGAGEWRSALCPFHNDRRPSLRINTRLGCFRCMACDVHGGDVLAFHQQLYQLNFIDTAKLLNA
ncbi:MAG: hypothetical protein GY821_11600, partial [Gammaproteobacteria bacterium]|nr:hypothetical protein [Gammaproteobacteria bacterium]